MCSAFGKVEKIFVAVFRLEGGSLLNVFGLVQGGKSCKYLWFVNSVLLALCLEKCVWFGVLFCRLGTYLEFDFGDVSSLSKGNLQEMYVVENVDLYSIMYVMYIVVYQAFL